MNLRQLPQLPFKYLPFLLFFTLLLLGAAPSTAQINVPSDNCSNARLFYPARSGCASSWQFDIPTSYNRDGNNNGSCTGNIAATDDDAWCRFYAISTSTTIQYTNNNQNAAIIVYTGGCTPIITNEAGCVDAINGAGTESLTIPTTINTPYLVRIVRRSSSSMSGTLCLYSANHDRCSTAPKFLVNNACNAVEFDLPYGFDNDGNTLAASPDCNITSYRDAWVSFVATAATTTVQYINTNENAALAAYTGGCTPADATRVGCVNAAGVGTETLALNTVPGTTYRIRVMKTTNNNNLMSGFLCISSPPPPLGEELIVNGDFTQGDLAFASKYDYVRNLNNGCGTELNPEGVYGIDVSARELHCSFYGYGHGFAGWGGPAGYCSGANPPNPACPPQPAPSSADGNAMMVNGKTMRGKIWCQAISVDPSAFYQFKAYFNNLIPNLQITEPQLRVTICPINPLPMPATAPCGGPGEPGLVPLGSDILLPESPDNWQQLACGYQVPLGVTKLNLCIENISDNANGNDFAIDDISMKGVPSGGIGIENCVLLLPVKMVKFSGKTINDYVLLDWTTVKESDSRVFEIERSTNGIHFKKINEVNAAGNSTSMINYEYRDQQLPLGVSYVYYRIRAVDFDGKHDFSKIIALPVGDGQKGLEAIVYPNPVNSGEQLVIMMSSSERGTVYAEMYDMLGQRVLEQTFMEGESVNEFHLDVNGIPQGTYLLRLRQGNQVMNKKVVVQ